MRPMGHMEQGAGIAREEYLARLARVRALIDAAGWDALLAYANRTHPGHVRYLTGYEPRLGIHDSAACLIPGRGEPAALITNASFDEPETQTWLEDVAVTADYADAAASRLPRAARRLAVAGLAALPYPVYSGLKQRLPDLEILDASASLLALRRVKSAAEVDLLRECARITDAGGRAFLSAARAGAREYDLAAEVESAMRRAGGGEVSFATQVCSGARTARVVAFATEQRLREGDLVQLDCGSTWAGYRGDFSRATTIGPPPEAARRYLEAVAGIYERCLPLLRPGAAASTVAREALAAARERGLEADLYRSPNHAAGFVGHGIGCSYHEPPEIHPESDAVLAENMVIVLEPILCRRGAVGVKIEDAVLITAAGPERLSQIPVRVWEE